MQEILKHQYLELIKKSCSDNAVVELKTCARVERLEGVSDGDHALHPWL